jgi:hypothetical protein
MPRRNERSGSQLLGVKSESNISRAVLAVGNGARNCFRLEAVQRILHQHVESRDVRKKAKTYVLPKPD